MTGQVEIVGTGSRALVIAAPCSGSGKTVVTLALLRALRRAGMGVASAKIGPDYIDPAFHALASGRDCFNIDPWAMDEAGQDAMLHRSADNADLVVVEGVMGLFDGAAGGGGSTADFAARHGLPVVLIVDAARQGASIAALVKGFATYRPDLPLAGVIVNNVASARHRAVLEPALTALKLPVYGFLPRDRLFVLPERHLGLVQAGEVDGIETFIEEAAKALHRHLDLQALADLARPFRINGGGVDTTPPGQRIAIARDQAFTFLYPHLLTVWREAGAEILFFSPLKDEAPPKGVDVIFLPGGYPELHAGRIASSMRFLQGLRQAAAQGVPVHGECGGYMVLGRGLEDGDGHRHAMAGLLQLETSFARRRLQLGYRRAMALSDSPFAPKGAVLRGHEFHYATILREEGEALFVLEDATGAALGRAGLYAGGVSGSFFHMIFAG